MTDLYTARLPVLWENVFRPLLWRGQKAPGDVRQYQLDCSSWVPVGDSIVTVSVGVAPNSSGDVVATTPLAVAPTIAGVTLASGNPGTLYAVTFTVTTAGGAELVRTVWLFCQNLSPAMLVPPTVQAVLPATLLPLTTAGPVLAAPPPGNASGMTVLSTGGTTARNA